MQLNVLEWVQIVIKEREYWVASGCWTQWTTHQPFYEIQKPNAEEQEYNYSSAPLKHARFSTHTFKRAAVPSPPSASGSFLTWANCTPTLLSMILTTVQAHASTAVASCTIHDKVSSLLFWSKATWMQHRNSVQLFLYTVHQSKLIRTNLKPNKLLKSCSETAQQLKIYEHSKHNQI